MNEPQSNKSLGPVEIGRIIEALPHRFPFLLIDRVLSYELDRTLTAIKNVTINEPFFPGHFPDHPVMPGVLILEALAQASGVLAQLSLEDRPEANPLFYLVRIDKARFSQVVTPGDQLILNVEQKRMIRRMGQYVCTASVDGKTVASAEILCAGRSAS